MTPPPMPPASASCRSRSPANHHISREEVLAAAGVTGTTSLLFLDVEQTRERLKTNPWIADATVLKLYPGELQIGIKEREAFALWQKDGRVSVIADDGTVLEPYVAPRLIGLPLVVGRGAETRAKEFLALLDRYPAMRDFVRASVLVGERRWNLRLKNGIDVRLPETDIAARARAAGRARPREEPDHARHRRDRSAAARSRDRAALGCGRAGAHGRGQGQAEEERGQRMSALQFGLTPKMKPLSPKRSALVAALDVGHQQDRLPDRPPEAASAAGVLRHRSHSVDVSSASATRSRAA